MGYTILFRRGIDQQHEQEFQIASKYFNVVEYRSQCPRNELIIGRYSVLPFYQELVADLDSIGSKLINSWEQHSWVADFDYYEAVRDFTPETWTDHTFYRSNDPGPFVIKGKTNSRKFHWNTQMFAETRQKAVEIANTLASDSLIGPQGIIYRKYEPLVTYEIGINGLPFTNEWRFFYYRDVCLSYGYYWTSATDPRKGNMTPEGLAFADKIASIAKDYVNFFVLDIAEKRSGGWTLIEINSGMMAGLSENDPDTLYKNLRAVLDK